MHAPELEKSLGIEVYATGSPGIGGVIRRRVEDFIVEEVLVDGSKATTSVSENHVDHKALGSASQRQRYLLCVLIKRNWDTFSSLKAVAHQLYVKTNRVQIAGIKDAKAVTAQYITVEGVSPQQIQEVKVKDIKLRPMGYLHRKLSSYYLQGNRFHIIIRELCHPKSEIRERAKKTFEELKNVGGAPNFFGHQRFGTVRPITHQVGKALINQNVEEAAMLFLAEPSLHEHPEARQARQELLKTQDFEKALKAFPKQLRYERWMLKHLTERSDDFPGAFRRLPFKLRQLFPQAYQSFLFNKFLSRRIEKKLCLDKVEVGDYVVNVERSGLPMLRMRRMVTADKMREINVSVRAGKQRLAIPLVGFKQDLSKGVQGEIERRILEEEGVSPLSFKSEAMPETSLRGTLRTALTPTDGLSLNEIKKDDLNLSKLKAEASFMLHRGSYATILLRELMKPSEVIAAGF